MAVDFPTDLIGGVMRAASPMKGMAPYKIPTAQNIGSGADFTSQLSTDQLPTKISNVTGELSTAKKFEALVVAQMMTNILPKDSEYFGDGFSGDTWRSMMSEQLANVAVRHTDFGIASLIQKEFVIQGDLKKSVEGVVPTDYVVELNRNTDHARQAMNEITRTFLEKTGR